jgi:hypothetical protein
LLPTLASGSAAASKKVSRTVSVASLNTKQVGVNLHPIREFSTCILPHELTVRPSEDGASHCVAEERDAAALLPWMTEHLSQRPEQW